MYSFKEIQTVIPAKDMVDVVLSRTQRRTPTEVHPQFKITRIRSFYMRKVKFCQTTFNEKLQKILDEFPKIDDLHPFYADLCNVLYDRDHYKLALGQVKSVQSTVDSIAKDYVKLLKFGDSPYKCKMLKRAALGRMCTAVKKLSASLQYLEEVRQHLSRLPQINPQTRTLIMTGYPNVGKSSFMNIVTDANVDVQPYAFTTKSIFVGHMDFKYTRWQVLDTPGILDHPLEERNTIEMTAITALAHIPATVLYFVDVSEQCGFTIEQQVSLFHSIKPLFKSKPLLVVLNKTDVKPLDELTEEQKKLIASIKLDEDKALEFLPASCLKREGVDAVKNRACEMLLEQRIERKVAQSSKVDAIKNRVYVTPTQARADRPPCIPQGVRGRQQQDEQETLPDADVDESQMTEKQLMERHGGAGVYSVDTRKNWDLKNEDWKYDNVPEIMDGHNIADFVDPDIDAKLEALEREEEALMWGDADDTEEHQRWMNAKDTLSQIHKKVEQQKFENRLNKNRNHYGTIRRQQKQTPEEVAEHLRVIGNDDVDTEALRSRAVLKRRRSVAGLDEEEQQQPTAVISSSLNVEEAATAEVIKRQKQRRLARDARKGEGDHHIPEKKPKHLFSGKMGFKRDRR
ncbi:Nucleolar GTP-binding protein 1 [Perkinsus olseni]|uniref:Nucleolar GTP-binding protein 1 n=1 Tax=Perkinsus olseni TaxID=32597 RepID=A0A7J6MYJ7_PEROL|nr:Nucleolar GTP-binding protein 1 [Perkinsus olseni]KAF4676260.1 Nucleolar GTP-binding protein 1 [Perkinsus olseni]